MTHEDFQNKLSEIPNLDLAEKAQSALSKLCRTGGNSFTMTVPPTLDDTDMIFSEVIKRFERLSLPAFPDPTVQLKADKEDLFEAKRLLKKCWEIIPLDSRKWNDVFLEVDEFLKK